MSGRWTGRARCAWSRGPTLIVSTRRRTPWRRTCQTRKWPPTSASSPSNGWSLVAGPGGAIHRRVPARRQRFDGLRRRRYRRSVRILVAEDDRKVASFIRQGLHEEGHAVEVAKDGPEALDLMLADPDYDLLVLDVMLPGRGGFSVLRTLRQRKV